MGSLSDFARVILEALLGPAPRYQIEFRTVTLVAGTPVLLFDAADHWRLIKLRNNDVANAIDVNTTRATGGGQGLELPASTQDWFVLPPNTTIFAYSAAGATLYAVATDIPVAWAVRMSNAFGG